jgi:hypothetical protein
MPDEHVCVFGKWEHAGPLMLGYEKRYCTCGAFQARRTNHEKEKRNA